MFRLTVARGPYRSDTHPLHLMAVDTRNTLLYCLVERLVVFTRRAAGQKTYLFRIHY